jgi:hypothetical protein
MPKTVAALPLGDDSFVREVGLVERSSRNQQTAAAALAECINLVTSARR